MMKQEPILLTPRWCEEKDILKGWIILHKSVTHPRGLRHLDYVKLTCIDTEKWIFSRIFGPGSKEYGGDLTSIVKESIYLDAHYQQRLELDDKLGDKQYEFELKKIGPLRYYINAVRFHPDDGIRIGAFLGIVSLFLGFLSVALSVLNN